MVAYNSPRLKKNNFDLLRLLFAATVCLVHVYALSGHEELSWIPRILSSEMAVKSFFIVSGFLIFMSYERSSSLSSYISKRIRRIYPAYFVVIVLGAFGLVFASTLTVDEYFSTEWFKYLGVNIIFLNFLEPSLPGVFDGNIFNAVNGALWTLKVEVMFYLSVPVFVLLFKKLPRNWVLLGGYILSILYKLILETLTFQTGFGIYAELENQLPGQLCYFIGGAFIFYNLSHFERNIGYYLGTAVIILAVNFLIPLSFFEPAALAVVVMFFGLFLYMGEFGKYGDFSYGIYILHFPIIQVFIHFGWFQEMPWIFLITSLLTTFTLAVLLWHGIEKRFLLHNSHYIAKSS